jgi:hypothetical protein
MSDLRERAERISQLSFLIAQGMEAFDKLAQNSSASDFSQVLGKVIGKFPETSLEKLKPVGKVPEEESEEQKEETGEAGERPCLLEGNKGNAVETPVTSKSTAQVRLSRMRESEAEELFCQRYAICLGLGKKERSGFGLCQERVGRDF